MAEPVVTVTVPPEIFMAAVELLAIAEPVVALTSPPEILKVPVEPLRIAAPVDVFFTVPFEIFMAPVELLRIALPVDVFSTTAELRTERRTAVAVPELVKKIVPDSMSVFAEVTIAVSETAIAPVELPLIATPDVALIAALP
jgi:hypothetical protein